MRYSAKEAAVKHERIPACSANRGFENVSVGEVIKAAGLLRSVSGRCVPTRRLNVRSGLGRGLSMPRSSEMASRRAFVQFCGKRAPNLARRTFRI
jgi:hypothetical protein